MSYNYPEWVNVEAAEALRRRARSIIINTIDGTDLYTAEIGGMEGDVILTQEHMEYLHYTLGNLLGPCKEES